MFGHKDKNDDKKLSSRMLSIASAGIAGISAWNWASRYGYRTKTILGKKYTYPDFGKMFGDSFKLYNESNMDPATRLELIDRMKLFNSLPYSTERLTNEITLITNKIKDMQKEYDGFISRFTKTNQNNFKSIKRSLERRKFIGEGKEYSSYYDYFQKHSGDADNLANKFSNVGLLNTHWEKIRHKYENDNFLDTIYNRIINKHPILTKDTLKTKDGLHTLTDEILNDLKRGLVEKSNKIGINLHYLYGKERYLVLGNKKVHKVMKNIMERIYTINDSVVHGPTEPLSSYSDTMFGSLNVGSAFEYLPDIDDTDHVKTGKFIDALHSKWDTATRRKYDNAVTKVLAESGYSDIFKSRLQKHPESILYGNIGQNKLNNTIKNIFSDMKEVGKKHNIDFSDVKMSFEKFTHSSNRFVFNVKTNKGNRVGSFKFYLNIPKHMTWAFDPMSTTYDVSQSVLGTVDTMFIQRHAIRGVLAHGYFGSLGPESGRNQGWIDSQLGRSFYGTPTSNEVWKSAYNISKVSTPGNSFRVAGLMPKIESAANELVRFKEDNYIHFFNSRFGEEGNLQYPYIRDISITTMKRIRDSKNVVESVHCDNHVEIKVQYGKRSNDNQHLYTIETYEPADIRSSNKYAKKVKINIKRDIPEKEVIENIRKYIGQGKIVSSGNQDKIELLLKKYHITENSKVSDLFLSTDKGKWINSRRLTAMHLTNLPAVIFRGDMYNMWDKSFLLEDILQYMKTSDPDMYGKSMDLLRRLQNISDVGIENLGHRHRVTKWNNITNSFYHMITSDFRWNKFKGMSSVDEFLNTISGNFEKSYKQAFSSSTSYSKGIVSLFDAEKIIPAHSLGHATSPASQVMNVIPLVPKIGGFTENPMTNFTRSMMWFFDINMDDGDTLSNINVARKYVGHESNIAPIKVKTSSIPKDLLPYIKEGSTLNPKNFGGSGSISFGVDTAGRSKYYEGDTPFKIVAVNSYGEETKIRILKVHSIGLGSKVRAGSEYRGIIGRFFGFGKSPQQIDIVAGYNPIVKESMRDMIMSLSYHSTTYVNGLSPEMQTIFIRNFNTGIVKGMGDEIPLLKAIPNSQGKVEINWVGSGDQSNMEMGKAMRLVKNIFDIEAKTQMMQSTPSPYLRESAIAYNLWSAKGGWSIEATNSMMSNIIKSYETPGYHEIAKMQLGYAVNPQSADPNLRSVESIVRAIIDKKTGPEFFNKLINKGQIPHLYDTTKLFFPDSSFRIMSGIVAMRKDTALDSSLPHAGTGSSKIKIGPYFLNHLLSIPKADKFHKYVLEQVQDQSYKILGRPQIALAVATGQIPPPEVNLAKHITNLEKNISTSSEAKAWNRFLHAGPSYAKIKGTSVYRNLGEIFTEAEYLAKGDDKVVYTKNMDIGGVMSRVYRRPDVETMEYLNKLKSSYTPLPRAVMVKIPGVNGDVSVTKIMNFEFDKIPVDKSGRLGGGTHSIVSELAVTQMNILSIIKGVGTKGGVGLQQLTQRYFDLLFSDTGGLKSKLRGYVDGTNSVLQFGRPYVTDHVGQALTMYTEESTLANEALMNNFDSISGNMQQWINKLTPEEVRHRARYLRNYNKLVPGSPIGPHPVLNASFLGDIKYKVKVGNDVMETNTLLEIMENVKNHDDIRKYGKFMYQATKEGLLPMEGYSVRQPVASISSVGAPHMTFIRDWSTTSSAVKSIIKINALTMRGMGGDQDGDIVQTILNAPGIREIYLRAINDRAGHLGQFKSLDSLQYVSQGLLTKRGSEIFPTGMHVMFDSKINGYAAMSPEDATKHIEKNMTNYVNSMFGRGIGDTRKIGSLVKGSNLISMIKKGPIAATKAITATSSMIQQVGREWSIESKANVLDRIALGLERATKGKTGPTHDINKYNEILQNLSGPNKLIEFSKYINKETSMDDPIRKMLDIMPKELQNFVKNNRHGDNVSDQNYVALYGAFSRIQKNYAKRGDPAHNMQMQTARTMADMWQYNAMTGKVLPDYAPFAMSDVPFSTYRENFGKSFKKTMTNAFDKKTIKNFQTAGLMVGGLVAAYSVMNIFNPNQTKYLGHIPGKGGEYWDWTFTKPEMDWSSMMETGFTNVYDRPDTRIKLHDPMLVEKFINKKRKEKRQYLPIASGIGPVIHNRSVFEF